jgi:DNA invertase Pin-like site-specific DNA recombinase
MAVYGYARVSTQGQAEDGESLGVQQRQIQGWCLMQGHDLTRTFVEEGVSASISIDKRPQGSILMGSLSRGDTIVCARLDRLFRSPLDALQTVEKARNKGVSIVIIDGLGEITGNGMGRAFMIIAATFAEMERETLKTRVRDVKRDQKERGRYLGGKVPYGYRVEYTLEDGGERQTHLIEVPEEQERIATIQSLRSQGMSLRAIRETMANEGVKLSLDTISRVSMTGSPIIGKEPVA